MRLNPMLSAALATSLLLMAPARAQEKGATLDTSKIEELTGLKGTLDAKEGVFEVSMPRADLKVLARP